MTENATIAQHAKISREFATRLASFAPEQAVRAVVMLQTGDAGSAVWRRRTFNEREALRLAIGEQAEAALPEVDRVLRQFGGKRLPGAMDALGGIAVETTPAGIHGLASLQGVKAVLQDQQISGLRR
jgi:hypothetical protein